MSLRLANDQQSATSMQWIWASPSTPSSQLCCRTRTPKHCTILLKKRKLFIVHFFYVFFYSWFLTFAVFVFFLFHFFYVYGYAPKYQGKFLVCENLLGNWFQFWFCFSCSIPKSRLHPSIHLQTMNLCPPREDIISISPHLPLRRAWCFLVGNDEVRAYKTNLNFVLRVFSIFTHSHFFFFSSSFTLELSLQ